MSGYLQWESAHGVFTTPLAARFNAGVRLTCGALVAVLILRALASSFLDISPTYVRVDPDPRYARCLLDSVCDAACNTSAWHDATHVVVPMYPDGARLSNIAIIYAHARLVAEQHGWGVAALYGSPSDAPAAVTAGPLPPGFSQAAYLLPRNAIAHSSDVCISSPYKQDYTYFRHSRDAVRCILSVAAPEPPLPTSHQQENVLLHFRNVEAEFSNNPRLLHQSYAPYEYYAAALRSLPQPVRPRTVWIITEPGAETAVTVQRIVKEFGAIVFSSDSTRAHAFGRVADVFIGSFGTFSWLIAYLTCAHRVILPYYSGLAEGTTWLPWDALFIDDDDRLRYFDCSEAGASNASDDRVLETALEVKAKRGGTTPFAASLARRDVAEKERFPCHGPRRACALPVPVPR